MILWYSHKPPEAHLVGYARWYIWNEDKPIQNWDVPYVGDGDSGLVGDVNKDLQERFLELLHEQKRKHIGGQKHICKPSQQYPDE